MAQIDGALFNTRLKRFFDQWDASYDALVVLSGNGKEEGSLEIKSAATFQHLTGYEMPDTVAIFLRTREVLWLTGPKKVKYLQEAKVEDVDLHSRGDSNDDTFKKLLDKMLSTGTRIATLEKPEWATGKFADAWRAAFNGRVPKPLEGSSFVSQLLAVKDEAQVDLARRAGRYGARVLKTLVSEIETVIEDETVIVHKKLARLTLQKMEEEETKRELQTKFSLDPDECICEYISVSSGASESRYPLFEIAEGGGPKHGEGNLANDCIVVSVGTKYMGYGASITRTFLIDPTPVRQRTYNHAKKVLEAVESALKPGATFESVYEAAEKIVAEKPRLADLFGKEVGYLTGLEFCDGHGYLQRGNKRTVLENMVFQTSVQFRDVSEKKIGSFCFWLTNTVVVKGPGKGTEVCTSDFSYDKSNTVYFLDKEDEDLGESETEAERSAKKKKKAVDGDPEAVPTERVLRPRQDRDEMVEESKLVSEKAVDLRQQKTDEITQRIAGGGGAARPGAEARKKYSETPTYQTPGGMPSDIRPVLAVDTKANALMVPMNGSIVPISLAIVRTTQRPVEEGAFSVLRINFATPAQVAERDLFPTVPKRIWQCVRLVSRLWARPERSL
jgi:nucleosome binding factor SPN SPT16 subunit